jgi:hypothetical protein
MEGEFWQGRGIRPRAFTLAKEETLVSFPFSGRATVGYEG